MTTTSNRLVPRDGAPSVVTELDPYVTFDALASNIPAGFEYAGASARIDPYYSHLWSGPSSAVWMSRRSASSYRDAGSDSKRLRRQTASINVNELWRSKRSGSLVQRSTAAAMMWRIASAEHMAAITGIASWSGFTRGHTSKTADKMVAAGLIQTGTLPSYPGMSNPPTLVRPGRFTSWPALSAELSYGEWLQITAGQPARMGSQSSALRHNIAMTELGLRIAQWCPVVNVFGEHLGSHVLLAPALRHHDRAVRAAADCVVLTDQGAKIAIEMTVSTLNAADKVVTWIRALQADDSNSLNVLFVVAPGNGAPRKAAGYVRNEIVKALRAEGATGHDLAHRFFVAEWDQWFPAPNQVTASFADLPAQGLDLDAGEWTWRSLLGERGIDWQPATDEDYACATSLILASHTMLGTPFWLRDEAVAAELLRRLDPFLVATAGFTELPTMPYSRDSGLTGKPDHSSFFSPSSLTE